MAASVLPILIGPEQEVLRTKAKPVKFVTKDLKKLIERMHATVRKARGIGLAAPQVGHSVRIIIAQISGTFLTMVNPIITEFSQEQDSAEEGCLSLPDTWGVVTRPKAIAVEFTNERNEKKVLKLEAMDARVVQHEIDHLDGVLFIDRIEEEAKKPVVAVM